MSVPYVQSHLEQYDASPNKRTHATAFAKPSQPRPRPQAAPAVPSFGAPLPTVVLPTPVVQQHLPPRPPPKKHPRKINQLGLTPAQEEHVSSSGSEADVDEEAKLIAATSDSGGLQFTYKGQTSTLKSAADIAAWIEERKKRYPTAERREARQKEAEERKRQWQEEKRRRDESRNEAKLQNKLNSKSGPKGKAVQTRDAESQRRKQNEVPGHMTRKSSTSTVDSMDVVTKARLKAEKLRKMAEKAQQAALKAEAKMARASATHRTQIATDKPVDGVSQCTEEDLDLSLSDVSTSSDSALDDLDNDEDETSSSGSSADLDLDSDSVDETASLAQPHLPSSLSSDDNDEPPESIPLKPTTPLRVLPPPRNNSNNNHRHHTSTSTTLTTNDDPQIKPCNRFVSTGRCPRGDKCRYSHDPELRKKKRAGNQNQDGGQSNSKNAMNGQKKERKSLYQLLMERQEDEETNHLLRAILYLKEEGVLEKKGEGGPARDVKMR